MLANSSFQTQTGFTSSHYVFTYNELKKLSLDNCFLKPRSVFERFMMVEELCLKIVDFGANLCGSQAARVQESVTPYVHVCPEF